MKISTETLSNDPVFLQDMIRAMQAQMTLLRHELFHGKGDRFIISLQG